jgi:hypothetical protein
MSTEVRVVRWPSEPGHAAGIDGGPHEMWIAVPVGMHPTEAAQHVERLLGERQPLDLRGELGPQLASLGQSVVEALDDDGLV